MNAVVTVENIITISPVMPSPAFIKMAIIESPPPNKAVLRPNAYIAILVIVYTPALMREADSGF